MEIHLERGQCLKIANGVPEAIKRTEAIKTKREREDSKVIAELRIGRRVIELVSINGGHMIISPWPDGAN